VLRRTGDLAWLALLSVVWTWPLAMHFRDHIPGGPGDNFSFVWNLWWMRHVLSHRALSFFHSAYLFSPFGVDLIDHPNTVLQGAVSATLLARLSIVEAENLYVVVSVFLNAAAAYALVYDITRERRLALLGGMAFGGSPYIAAHLLGDFDLLTAWVIPLFALFFRRSLRNGSWKAAVVCGVCAAIAGYSAYYHALYIALFAVAYTLAWWDFCHVDIRRWRVRFRFERVAEETFWRSAQALLVTVAVFSLLAVPLIMQGFRLAASGRYLTQYYFWRTAPLGVDLTTFVAGNPFHPILGGLTSFYYRTLSIDRIQAVGWLGVVPIAVLVAWRGRWLNREEARCWKAVIAVFAIWALGPFLRVAGLNIGLPLPEGLAPFLPFVDARMPGRAMVGVYLSLAVLMGLRLAGLKAGPTPVDVGPGFRPAFQWALIALLAFDYMNAPIRLTDLDRPMVYVRLAAIDDDGPVIEVPFGLGDGWGARIGAQNRRILYYATIHGHPLVGGFTGRFAPGVVQAYLAMPIVGNLLRLSGGQPTTEEAEGADVLPFRYLVLDTVAASPELIAYVHSAIDMDLLDQADGRELYAVQGVKPIPVRASR
jgi:hypothetical protein